MKQVRRENKKAREKPEFELQVQKRETGEWTFTMCQTPTTTVSETKTADGKTVQVKMVFDPPWLLHLAFAYKLVHNKYGLEWFFYPSLEMKKPTRDHATFSFGAKTDKTVQLLGCECRLPLS